MKIFSLIRNSRLKTLFTILVVCALIFANFTVLSNAAVNPASTNVISAISTVDNVTLLLSSIGLISLEEGVVESPDKVLTRAEFASMLAEVSACKKAAGKELLSGSDSIPSSPDAPVTLEQGVDSVLGLLGYTKTDFTSPFQFGEMSFYKSSGLSENITGGIGKVMTRNDAINLLCNMMDVPVKDGSKKYSETIR